MKKPDMNTPAPQPFVFDESIEQCIAFARGKNLAEKMTGNGTSLESAMKKLEKVLKGLPRDQQISMRAGFECFIQ